jgi:hypothetical protein
VKKEVRRRKRRQTFLGPVLTFDDLPTAVEIDSSEFWVFGYKWKASLMKKLPLNHDLDNGVWMKVCLCPSSSVHALDGRITPVESIKMNVVGEIFGAGPREVLEYEKTATRMMVMSICFWEL